MFFKSFKYIIPTLLIIPAFYSCLYLIADYKHEFGTYFPHETHTGEYDDAENDVCLTCHIGQDEDKDQFDWELPTKKLCLECHDEEDERPQKVTLRPRSDSIINFNHYWHVQGDPALECRSCHESVITKEYLPVRGGYPKMQVCAMCHGDWIGGEPDQEVSHSNPLRQQCFKCHKEKIMPRDHHENWLEIHRTQAIGQWETRCRSCHSDKEKCTECHVGGLFRPEWHDLAWVRTHRFHVRNQVQNCKSCHPDDFCQDCHRLRGVSGSRDYRQRMDAVIHPPGWISDVPHTGNHHSVTARMKLDTCKACHKPDTDCRSCHFKRFPLGM